MKPPTDSAPREWTLFQSHEDYMPSVIRGETFTRQTEIAVIEKFAYDQLKLERDTLREIIDHKSKTISAMDSVLIQCGVNFDFDKLHGEQSKYLLHERDALQARVAKLRAALEEIESGECIVDINCGYEAISEDMRYKARQALAADKGETP